MGIYDCIMETVPVMGKLLSLSKLINPGCDLVKTVSSAQLNGRSAHIFGILKHACKSNQQGDRIVVISHKVEFNMDCRVRLEQAPEYKMSYFSWR